MISKYRTGEEAINAMKKYISLNKENWEFGESSQNNQNCFGGVGETIGLRVFNFFEIRREYIIARDNAIFFGQDITKFPRRLK